MTMLLYNAILFWGKKEFTEVSPAPPTGLRAHFLSVSDQQVLSRKEYPIGRQRRGPLQKQQVVVSGLTPPFSQPSGCLHPRALKTGPLTLNYTQTKDAVEVSFKWVYIKNNREKIFLTITVLLNYWDMVLLCLDYLILAV